MDRADMDDPYLPVELIPRDVLIKTGNCYKREYDGVSDLQVLSALEAYYSINLCEGLDVNHPFRLIALRLLEVTFQDFRDEIRAEPPALAFVGHPATALAQDPLDPLVDELELGSRYWLAIRGYRSDGSVSKTSLKSDIMVTDRAKEKARLSELLRLSIRKQVMERRKKSAKKATSRIPISTTRAQVPSSFAPDAHDSASDSPVIQEGEATAPGADYPSSVLSGQEDEPISKTWLTPAADRVLGTAQMQRGLLHEIITQMQQDQQGADPEISDVEAITIANACDTANDAQEVASLVAAAEIQATKSLAALIIADLRLAQAESLPIAQVGGLELTQAEISQLLEAANNTDGSSSTLEDFLQAYQPGHRHVDASDPSSKEATDANTEDSQPQSSVDDLFKTSREVIAENRRLTRLLSAPTPAPSRSTSPSAESADNSGDLYDVPHLNAYLAAVENDLAEMDAFKSSIGSSNPGLTAAVEEIQRELMALRVYRAAYPGGIPDLVPDVGDADDYKGVMVGKDEGEEGLWGEGAEEEPGKDQAEKKKPSRAQQRRLARQKAKDKGKGKATA